jgi:hypothetical protein
MIVFLAPSCSFFSDVRLIIGMFTFSKQLIIGMLTLYILSQLFAFTFLANIRQFTKNHGGLQKYRLKTRNSSPTCTLNQRQRPRTSTTRTRLLAVQKMGGRWGNLLFQYVVYLNCSCCDNWLSIARENVQPVVRELFLPTGTPRCLELRLTLAIALWLGGKLEKTMW